MANIILPTDKAFSEDSNRRMWGMVDDVQMEYEFFFTPEPNYKGLEIYVDVDAEDADGNNIGAEVIEFILSSNIYGGALWNENNDEYLWDSNNNSDLFKIKYTTDWKVFPQGYELVGDEIFLFRVKFKKNTVKCTDIRIDVHAKPVTLMEVYNFTNGVPVNVALPPAAFHDITNIQLVGVNDGTTSIDVNYLTWERERDASHFLIYSPPITANVTGNLSILISGY